MTREQLQQIFRKAYDAQTWQNMLITLFGASDIKTTPTYIENDNKGKADGFILGEINTSDRYKIGLFAFEVNDSTNLKLNRVGLRSLVSSYTKYQVDAALVVYHNETHWRLSFIFDIPKDADKTAPKRYTYVFGNADESYRTAADRLVRLTEAKPTFESIKDAFSVEKMSKEFFDNYKARYNKFCTELGATQKSNRDYVKKMMGRLVFLQFLQKKGWMNGDQNYMQNLYTNSDFQADFLEQVLEPLFFHVLNTKESERNHPKLKNLGEEINIPYLNGGLFEADNNDKRKIKFSANLFKDLFEFFSHYNFTIDENDPNDVEMGIDPEMLGRIFENLLEDNKDKGAYYTPKEIVQYMCRQSLIEYLQSKLGKHSEIENFINTHETGDRLSRKNFITQNAKEIERLLDEVKICDPAIGSGAFPMGILNEIFQAKMALNMTLDRAEVKKRIIQNNIYGVDIEQGAVDIARLRFWLSLVVDEEIPQPLPNLDYKIMCGNSLLSRYDLDMPFDDIFKDYNRKHNNEDPMNLSKYKSLIYDYTLNSNSKEKIEFRQKINNIKSHFATIFSDKKKLYSSNEHKLIEKYHKYLYNTNNLFDEDIDEKLLPKHKKTELGKIRKILLERENTTNSIRNNQLYGNAFEWRFEFPQLLDNDGNFVGFDIVIGNPPYLRIQGIRDTNPLFADELVKKYKSATGSFDMYAIFAERGLQIINPNGLVNYIMPVKWTNAAFGKGLRGVVTQDRSACKIINFGAYQVFNASTYTGLHWFKPNTNEMLYYELDRNLDTNQELGEYLKSLDADNAAKIKYENLGKDAWVLTVGQTTEILHKLEQHPRRISDIFDKIFQGLATSKDDVYFLYECREQGDKVTGISKYLGERVTIERGLVKPLLKGEDVHRYDYITTDKFVIFPYKLENSKANLYAEKELSELYPLGYTYLKQCEDILRAREKGRFNIEGEWFQFGRKQGILYAETEKLVAPEISLGGNFSYDKNGEFYSTTKIYGYIKKDNVKESYKFWLGLFNSRLFWFFLQNTGYILRGGYFTFKTNYINPFPVPAYETIAGAESIIEKLSDFLMYLYKQEDEDIFDHTPNKRVRVHIEDVMDMIIYELYFKEHMIEKGIDVIADLKSYRFDQNNIAKEIERFYTWYQKSDNPIRQKIMLLDTRSNQFLYLIHSCYYDQNK